MEGPPRMGATKDNHMHTTSNNYTAAIQDVKTPLNLTVQYQEWIYGTKAASKYIVNVLFL